MVIITLTRIATAVKMNNPSKNSMYDGIHVAVSKV